MENNTKDSVKVEENKYEDNEESSSLSEKSEPSCNKITVLFHAAGNAPILKKRRWVVEPEKKLGSVSLFLRKLLKAKTTDSLFLYVNQAFAPAPDQTMANLFDCYGVEGKLNIHYCMSQAWG